MVYNNTSGFPINLLSDANDVYIGANIKYNKENPIKIGKRCRVIIDDNVDLSMCQVNISEGGKLCVWNM